MVKISVFWFRRDLRLKDNVGLYNAIQGKFPVLPLFIFDTGILERLEVDDARVSFIYDTLKEMNQTLESHRSGMLCVKGKPQEVFEKLLKQYDIQTVYANEDYEPYARKRDREIHSILKNKGIGFYAYKDQVVFARDEVMKGDGKPYTVFTPYKRKWLAQLTPNHYADRTIDLENNLFSVHKKFPSLKSIGFKTSKIKVLPFQIEDLENYKEERDYPGLNSTSKLGPHLRFGTVGIRRIVSEMIDNETFVSELIWREFFMQILYHYPHVVNNNFRDKYDSIQWRNNKDEFQKWCEGQTGYPMVDAGMRELNETGNMHNRVRMVAASFLCKHLLIDWKWGEAYFAKKLLDYDLSANNGNWQWSAGTGCDAAPYFRVFNPSEQIKKFDADFSYIKKWVPELNTLDYPSTIVEHKYARERAIEAYKVGLNKNPQ